MLSDFRYAFRQLGKNPSSIAITILILALGIGANTAVFTFIDGILLRGLPVRDPAQLVLVGRSGAKLKDPRIAMGKYLFSYPDFEQFRDRGQSLAAIAAENVSRRKLAGGGLGQSETISVSVGEVSGDFFSMLGVSPYLGQAFTLEDDRKGNPRPVAILSYACWTQHYGGDPAVLGKQILIDNVSFSVVGIVPPDFSGVEAEDRPDVWIPIQMLAVLDTNPSAQGLRTPVGGTWLHILGRLRPGVKRESASAELDVIFQGELAAAKIPAEAISMFMGKIDLQAGGSGFSQTREQARSLLMILMAMVGLVLVIACANVASLLLARTVVRQREFALRSALGAARGRLIRQLLTESTLLALFGGMLGLLFAHWGAYAIAGYLPGGGSLDLKPDRDVLLFAALVSIGTGIFVGVIPALRLSGTDLISVLKAQANMAPGSSRHRLGKVLVVAQIGLSLCLLAAAGLFVRTLENLQNSDLGFRRQSLVIVGVTADRNYDLTQRARVFENVRAGLEGLPGVTHSTFVEGGLLLASNFYNQFGLDGYVPRANEALLANYTFAGPQFFETLGIKMVRGRGFSDADIASAANQRGPAEPKSGGSVPSGVGVAVVNESLARQYFGDVDPVGHILHDAQQGTYRIIGVAKNAKYSSLREENLNEIYLPISKQPGGSGPGMQFVLRSGEGLLTLAPAIRAAIHKIDPKVRVGNATTMDEIVDRATSSERTVAQVAGYFSLFALALASMGLYGILAYGVAQRTREIGVRMALGANGGDVLFLVIKQGMLLAAVGCVAGTIVAIALSHLIVSRLYGVAPTDPVTFLATAALMLMVAFFACWVPARRAVRVDPMIALRAE
jgi:predicted permease